MNCKIIGFHRRLIGGGDSGNFLVTWQSNLMSSLISEISLFDLATTYLVFCGICVNRSLSKSGKVYFKIRTRG